MNKEQRTMTVTSYKLQVTRKKDKRQKNKEQRTKKGCNKTPETIQ